MVARKVVEPFKDHIKSLHGDKADIVYNKWVKVLSKCVQFGGSFGNHLQVYHDGSQMFDDYWKCIDEAKRSVWVETYTISPDETGLITIKKLTQAAMRGCDVILIKDAWGSSNMKQEHIQPLIDAGGKVFTFNERHLKLYNFFSRARISTPWFRDHRKCAIIDGKIGFCGGMNIDDKYSGHYEKLLKNSTPHIVKQVSKISTSSEDHNWYPEHPMPATLFNTNEEIDLTKLDPAMLLKTVFRDTHCKLRGPSVKYLIDSFLESIEEANADKMSAWQRFVEYIRIRSTFIIKKSQESDQEEEEEEEYTIEKKEDGIWVQVLSSSPRHGRRQLYRALMLVFGEAQKHVYIATPYFLPPKKLADAILRAKDRGCDVRILTCGLSDVPKMRVGCIWLYGRFLRRGVRIYEYNKSTLHSKYLTVDGMFSSLGSYNIDRMSTLSNLEIGLNAFDTLTAEGLEKQFFEDLKYASEITYAKWEKRPIHLSIAGWILYKMMRLLGP